MNVLANNSNSNSCKVLIDIPLGMRLKCLREKEFFVKKIGMPQKHKKKVFK